MIQYPAILVTPASFSPVQIYSVLAIRVSKASPELKRIVCTDDTNMPCATEEREQAKEIPESLSLIW